MIVTSVQDTVAANSVDSGHRLIEGPIHSEKANGRVHFFRSVPKLLTVLVEVVISNRQVREEILYKAYNSLIGDYNIVVFQQACNILDKCRSWFLGVDVIALGVPKAEQMGKGD